MAKGHIPVIAREEEAEVYGNNLLEEANFKKRRSIIWKLSISKEFLCSKYK